ncbi:MAG: redox-sensing transcriptional repressor Rex [Bacteroidales bacterium]|jgi:redox-sensing transcriptional repressor|nr:redox-sensing transcriptional repressor Rex [Bacteroidales bacterium]HNT41798.1 redox-sensing transcriptional repressor Rex [Tenuifilaceae bacterium]MBP8642518.1 redox-sensing transcriptional repressor Rex [Bacteroidales bacterium]NLI88560.1 redox-sensing transcriptional repressor Rex [Bacteroidales bacterium]HOA08792.1 redox-sensing transcriptional repressor Rex [Tenuifilaceae bacterium]
MKLPEKTVERLSEYRRTLLSCIAKGKTHIYSHELAGIHNITAVQVRRDLMLIGYSSIKKKGYDTQELADVIGALIDHEKGLNVAVVGMGNMGRAITSYFNGKRPKLNIVAAFDVDPNKVNRVIAGVNCFHMKDLLEISKRYEISIAIITSPPDSATQVAEQLVSAGIKGILNFTTIPLNVPDTVYLEEFDMITSLEKVAYFVKTKDE